MITSVSHTHRSVSSKWHLQTSSTDLQIWFANLKLQVSFAGYSLFHRALLQKRPIILRSKWHLQTSSTDLQIWFAQLSVLPYEHTYWCGCVCTHGNTTSGEIRPLTIYVIIIYGVAMISRLLKITSLLCRISSLLRALLQKRPIIWWSLLIVATPYHICTEMILVKPITDRVAQDLEIISFYFFFLQLRRRTRILSMGFTISAG